MKALAKTAIALAAGGLLSGSASAQVLFQENFEAYSGGGFHQVWGGWGVAQEGGNSFLRSVGGESVDYLMYTTERFSGDLAINFDSRTTNSGGLIDVTITSHRIDAPAAPTDWGLTFGYYNSRFSVQRWWRGDNVSSQVLFDGNNSFAANVWHDVTLKLTGGMAELYVDGVRGLQYDLSQAAIPYPIDNYHISWMTWGQRDLDNISVTAVPEPETYAMLLAGLGLLGLVAGRRQQKAVA